MPHKTYPAHEHCLTWALFLRFHFFGNLTKGVFFPIPLIFLSEESPNQDAIVVGEGLNPQEVRNAALAHSSQDTLIYDFERGP